MEAENSPLSQLQSEEHIKLLDAIDNLRGIGLRHEVSLPQIIVCGDQSSGKSSVLEAISHATFPVRHGRCTRFATEIILRKSSREETVAEIEPGKGASQEHKEYLGSFRRTGKTLHELQGLVDEATVWMGISPERGWSDDVLRLRISGPRCPPLTLVDLPGLIPTTDRMTREEILVQDLVRSYMKDRRSIILLIIPALGEPEGQVALNMAHQIDPEGKRTMGIIPIPDRAEENESIYVDIASHDMSINEARFNLGLGWHVIRNRNKDELGTTNAERDTREREFFSKEPWNRLLPNQLGVDSLREKLSSQLLEYIRSELPLVRKEIESGLVESRAQLEKLGSDRSSKWEQREYLFKIAGDFNDILKYASDGNWQHPTFTDNHSLRLRARLRNLNDEFWTKMKSNGHTYGVKNLIFSNELDLTSWVPILTMIHTEMKSFRSKELPGTPVLSLVGPLFKKQSKNWRPIAKQYIDHSWSIVNVVLRNIFLDVAGQSALDSIFPALVQTDLNVRYDNLVAKLEELLEPYEKYQPATINPRFKEILEDPEDDSLPEDIVKLLPKDIDHQACLSLWRRVQAYYNIAMPNFVDNVIALAIEKHLIQGLETILNSKRISRLEDTELQKLAGEKDQDAAIRRRLMRKIGALETAEQTCDLHQGAQPRIRSEPLKTSIQEPSDFRFINHNEAPLLSSTFSSKKPAINHQEAKASKKSTTASPSSAGARTVNIRPEVLSGNKLKSSESQSKDQYTVIPVGVPGPGSLGTNSPTMSSTTVSSTSTSSIHSFGSSSSPQKPIPKEHPSPGPQASQLALPPFVGSSPPFSKGLFSFNTTNAPASFVPSNPPPSAPMFGTKNPKFSFGSPNASTSG